MNILITGATGFIGSNLSKALFEKGHQVRSLIRQSRRIDSELRIKEFKGDLRNKESLVQAVNGTEIVFHIAGVLGEFGIPDQVYLDTHILGTKNLIDVCRENTNLKQFIFCSTIGVYGPCQKESSYEESLYNPTNIYEYTKMEAERLVIEAAKTCFPMTIIRPGLVYGPHSLHILQMFKAVQNKKFFLIGQGKNTLHPVYIDDLIQGFLLVLNNPKAIGEIYNIAGNEAIELRYFFQVIADNVGVKLSKFKIPTWFATSVLYPLIFLAKIFHFQPILTKSRLRFFIDNRACSINKAKRELDYKPKFNFEQGVKLTTQGYRERGYLK